MSRRITIWSFADVDRSGKVRWTANELGYEIDEQRVKPGEHGSEPYTARNPYAQIPTAELDGQVMIESTAICLALAERHAETGLIPQERSDRDRFWQIMSMAVSTLETPVVLYYLSKRGIVDAAWADLWSKPLIPRLKVFAGNVPAEGYVCDAFSLADICSAYVLRIGVQAGLLPFEGKLEGYLHRLMARPAAQAARFFEGL